MFFKLSSILFFVSFFLSLEAAASTPHWTVQPNVCIAKSVGDSCQITIQVFAQNIPHGKHCIYLQGEQISCFTSVEYIQELNVLLIQNTQLELKDQQQKTILSKQLLIKYQDAPPLRRRIRTPWSLF